LVSRLVVPIRGATTGVVEPATLPRMDVDVVAVIEGQIRQLEDQQQEAAIALGRRYLHELNADDWASGLFSSGQLDGACGEVVRCGAPEDERSRRLYLAGFSHGWDHPEAPIPGVDPA